MDKWISVYDDMPEKDTYVLVFCPSAPTDRKIVIDSWGDIYEVGPTGDGWLNTGEGWENHDDWHEVTHWMPLPEGPKWFR